MMGKSLPGRPESQSHWFKAASWAAIALFTAVIGLPFFMMLSISLQTMDEIYSRSLVIIPEKLQFINYVNAMRNGNWGRYMSNSLFISVTVTAVSLVINSMTGYTFARLRFKGRNVLFIALLVGMMTPPQTTMVPLFIMFKNFPLAGGNNIFGSGGNGLINTYVGLMLPFIAGSFGVFLCRQYYLTFPVSLDDAARMDGCGKPGIYLRIYLPLSKPILASLGILKFTGTWNEYTWPLVMTNSEPMKTVQLALTMFRNEAEIFWNELMAATLVSSLVIYVLFFFLHKYFIAGLIEGSIKE